MCPICPICPLFYSSGEFYYFLFQIFFFKFGFLKIVDRSDRSDTFSITSTSTTISLFYKINIMKYVVLKDHPDYSINKNGKIRNVSTKKVLKPTENSDGYATVSIDGESLFVHRLVAIQFLKPVAGKTEVDHVNHTRSDNKLSNLR